MPEPEFLNVPPAEAVASFRAKGFHVAFSWQDTAAAEHLSSFTVAKAMRLDVLQDIRSAVDGAIADGTTFADFRKTLEPKLRAKGWWGRQPQFDPLTGKTRIVQLGSVRRLRIIFDTNLRTSYARGRWQRIERIKETTPWLRYNAVLDGRTRPDHMAWHGTVLPVDHPFWATHYPPNGWRCRCIVQQLSDDDLEDFGYKPSPGVPPGSERTRPWTNRRTGEAIQVPVGIDPGFNHNVGLLSPAAPMAPAAQALKSSIAAAPPALAQAAQLKTLDDWVALGRQERERLATAAGGIDAPGFASNFRAAVTRELVERRGAGTVAADVGLGSRGLKARARIKAGTRVLPRSWITAGNQLPSVAIGSSKRGKYLQATTTAVAEIHPGTDVGVPLHEWVHHLQRAAPALNQLFIDLHRRRTASDPRKVLYSWAPKETGRKDKYIEAYFGREYGNSDNPREVITMAVQTLFHPLHGKERLVDLARHDPEMLDLVIGALYHFDP